MRAAVARANTPESPPHHVVVAQTVVALAEALAVARASRVVDPRVLFETLTKGSAHSFVLRNHGMKSLLPDRHPAEGAGQAADREGGRGPR